MRRRCSRVKKLLPESLLNYRFRGTKMSYCDLIIALEKRIVDKVSTVPSSKNRRTRVLQWKLGWQQKQTEKVRAKKEIREMWISRCRLSTKEQAKENGDSAKVKIGKKRAVKEARMEESEESTENEEDLLAWCLLEESVQEKFSHLRVRIKSVVAQLGVTRCSKQSGKQVGPLSRFFGSATRVSTDKNLSCGRRSESSVQLSPRQGVCPRFKYEWFP